MHDRTFERVGAASGLVFVVLAVLSGFIYPQQPRVDATPAMTLAWVHDHRVALQAGMIFDFFAAAALLWFVGYLHRVLVRAEGDDETLAPIVFGSGVGVAITTAMAALPTVVLAFMVAQPGGIGDPSLVRMLGDLNTIFFSVTSVMTAVFLGSLGWAMVRGELSLRWLGWVGLVVAVFNAVAVWIGVTFSSYHGKGWLVIGWGAYIGFIVFMLILSGSMLRQRQVTPAAVSASAALS
jgi:hypothetical protein